MASTNFSPGTVIASTWLNDVNTAVYTTLPGLASSITASITKTSLGLGNVDNTSDANKPVSTATQTALNAKQDASAKDASGGFVGLTGYAVNFKNTVGTVVSNFTNANTAVRTYTFPDKSGTVAMTSDIPPTGFSNLVIVTSTQGWVCPANITKAEITVVDGGQGGGNVGANGISGAGGTTGISVLSTLTPGSTYTCTVGAGGAASGTNAPGAVGGSSSFAGTGITTLTSANAQFRIIGGTGFFVSGAGSVPSNGGGSFVAPAGNSGYGCGGFGNAGNGGGGTAGFAGVVIIRY